MSLDLLEIGTKKRVGKSHHRVFRKRDHRLKNQDDGFGRDDDDDDRGHRGL